MEVNETFAIGGELVVNRIGFGGMSLGGGDGWPADPDHARHILERALELGIDFIDTADAYGHGASECIIGETLDVNRSDIVVATKGGIRHQAGDAGKIYTGRPIHIRNAALRSAIRLRAETIDLYQYHRPSIDTPFEETVRTLAELKDEGVIRHIGLSNVTVDQLETARNIAEIATVQNKYSVVEQGHDDVLSACEEYNIGFIPWAPLNGGHLDDRAGVLDEIAETHDATRHQIALAWLLHRSPVLLPISGTLNADHLADNVAAMQVTLTEQETAKLSR